MKKCRIRPCFWFSAFQILITFFLSALGHAQTPESSRPLAIMSEEQWRRYILSNPKPEYPLEARARRITGEGIFDLEISLTTGRVTSVKIVRSTGSAILDRAAIRALKNWRFRPDTVAAARVPIRFNIP